MGVKSLDPADLRDCVDAALDRLRPGLEADGGNVERVDAHEDGTLRVAFQGACAARPPQVATARTGLGEPLRESLAGVAARGIA